MKKESEVRNWSEGSFMIEALFCSCFLGNIASVEGVSKMDEIGGGDDGNG